MRREKSRRTSKLQTCLKEQDAWNIMTAMASVSRRDFIRFVTTLPILAPLTTRIVESNIDHAWFLGSRTKGEELMKIARAHRVTTTTFEVTGRHELVLRFEGNAANLRKLIQATNEAVLLPYLTDSKRHPNVPFAFVSIDTPHFSDKRKIELDYRMFSLDRCVSTVDMVRFPQGKRMIFLEIDSGSAQDILDLLERVLGADWIRDTETVIVSQATE